MDAKDLRTESAVSERNNDGSKYSQSGGIALHCDRNKSYQDIGSNSLGKVDVPNSRPCAVIGPDRVVPPPAASEAYHIKKGPAEPWPCMDNAYRRPPEYPHKLTNFQNPTRNISPRQTFQENMQRIMVPPTYNSIKISDDTNYAQLTERNNGLSKNIKLNIPPEAKFCDVPYAVNPNNNEQKSVRNPEMCLPSANPNLTRNAPHGWPPASVNLRSTRMYGAPELYQYQEYPSCAGPRPVVPRPHRTVPEEPGYVYADPYYQDGNIRFKPYPSVKERYPQQRYEYIGNYSNPFHPPPGFVPHKYELQKSIPPHPYPPYPPIKYLDSRVAEPVMEGYQRNSQGNYNMQYRNQVIHPNYGPVLGNCPQNKMHSYPPDAHIKTIAPNKIPYDNNTKTYIEYDNNRPKIYPPPDSYFVNEMTRMPMKSQVIMPNYPTLNMHNIPPNPYYKKDNQPMKNYEHMAHFRTMDPNLNVHNPMSRHAPVFSPNTLAISPTDSNTSNDTAQTLGTSQEDCGYVSQSSNASVRSMDSGINRIPNDYLRKYYDNRYGQIVRTSPMMSKTQLNSNNNMCKDKKQIDVRQFLQMWNEGDEEAEENSSKEIIIQTGSSDKKTFGKTHEAMNNQEQLYVLGLVNVPSEELAKYEHIQKVSKLPENIKGYNSIELLHQFEEVIESSNMTNYKSPTPKDFQISMKGVIPKQVTGVIPPRPVSPLDVEAKISQSVIHKEVGCNFEIKPCSPKMLNVEVAAPVQNILAERSIEKVVNPVMIKSPLLNRMDENIDCNIMKRPDHRLHLTENTRIPSCKMINPQFSNSDSIDSIKSSYSLQDLESNSGLCLASLPRLDNDIELNFPEVNQQFINANKGDSCVLTPSLRDLPTLEVLDQSENQSKDNFENINPSRQENNAHKSPYLADSEKEISKLSKYRKIKNNSFDPKENQTQHNVNAIRTDSVIIKNPENVKNHEDNSDTSSNSCSKAITHAQQVPINLTSQGNLLGNTESNEGNEKQLPVEIAIDFSLNKSGALGDTECTEANIELQIETPMIQEEENQVNALINQDNSSERTSVILPDFSKQTNEILHMDNLVENCSLGHEIESVCTSEKVDDNDTNNNGTDLIEITSNDSLPKTEIKESARNINSVEIIKDVSSKALLDTNTNDVSGNEILSDSNSDNYLNEMDTREDSTTDELVETKIYSCTETDSKLSENLTNNLQVVQIEEDIAINTTNVVAVPDSCENKNVDKVNCPINTEIELKISTSQVECNENKDFLETEQIDQIINQNLTNNLQVVQIEEDIAINTANVVAVADYCENKNVDKVNCPINTEIEPKINTSEVECNENKDFLATKNIDQIQPENIDCNTLLSTNEEMCCEDGEHSDSTHCQSISSSDSHSFSRHFITNNCTDKIEINNTTELLLEELSDHERELKDFEERYGEDTETNSPQKSDECLEKSPTEEVKECEKPVKRYLGYGSKEIYSPWIQKLLMFTEGHSRNLPTKIDNDDCIPESTETVNKTTINKVDDCLMETDATVQLEEISCTNAAKGSKQEVTNEAVEEIVNVSVCNIPSLDVNTNITVYDAEDRDSSCLDVNSSTTVYDSEDRDSSSLDVNTSTTMYDSEDRDSSCLDVNTGTTMYDSEDRDSSCLDVNTSTNVYNAEDRDSSNLDVNTSTTMCDSEDGDSSKIHSNIIDNDKNELVTEVNDNIIINPVVTGSNDVHRENDVFDSSLELMPDGNDNIAERVTPLGTPIVDNFYNNEKLHEIPDTSSNLEDVSSGSLKSNSGDKNITLESPVAFENLRHSYNRIQPNASSYKKCQSLKRSLSDSALNMYNGDEQPKQEHEENVQFIWPFKRRKVNNVDSDLLAQNLCNIIHNNRRNSISSFYNEENVSFCILIDNSCIITEEENEEPEKVCYTELSEDCLDEIQNNCIKADETTETLTEEAASTPYQENVCDYSDSYAVECEEEKTLDESWVEDVACVETVISDDIAEDIIICGPSSPKDDVLADNDESGVFSSSEHTDKVKYIYGDKMCNDDAQFVETLYNTPQMDVNKALYGRETHVSEEYDRYYDNDSLEKMLSESNEQELLPYVPEYSLDSMFCSGVLNSKETPENKENVNIETFPPFQSKGNALDIVVDINVNKTEHENMNSIEVFAKSQDNSVHSCESSVDNVLTYHEKDEETIYTTSSSPEVSSTTSEEKNSGILLKITNYKGARISQINDISRVDKRSRCKFTEDKEYLQSHTNFPSNRPLLTKAAQKYIPPLKESIRDLKVKLSLPQHSLMKLKQLKISKDEPKVNNQNSTALRIPKKPKPKFEDVLKSIDEIQFKMHKEKTKKSKKSIPKVVIKKNQNGSHYASTSNKDDFNPDLTGRKWQPWVFIEKSHFIDKMAIKKKTKAIYSHRKRTYVLAEKFQKYKSVSSAKFVISPPISDNPSTGLKYTIRLKHNY